MKILIMIALTCLATSGPSGQYNINITPEDECMWNMYNGLIGYNTYYFAIKYNSIMVV